MNNLKYPEKKYLLEYDLSLEFFNELELDIIDIAPVRKVFILYTTEGNKILKRVDYTEERLEFINSCINQISNHCKNIVKYKIFSDGKCYKCWNGSRYIVMDLIDGREITFSNPIEYNGAANLLANFHKAGRKIITEKFLSMELIEKSLILKFKEGINNVSEIYQWVNRYKHKNEFDKRFIENAEKAIIEMKYAQKLLEESDYELDRQQGNEIVICHNDLAEHNFIIDSEKINLIDFDYLSIDLRVVDVVNIMLKGIKNAGFDIEKAKALLDEYNKSYPLRTQDYQYMYILLTFPIEFYTIVKNYYFKQKLWNEEVFSNRLSYKLENDICRRRFLTQFKDIS
jgi:CotS family spore coat protein